ncbi:MAG: RND transporter [Balneolales bacterium]
MNKKASFSLIGILIILIFWVFAGGETSNTNAIFITPSRGEFNVAISVGGELRARNSLQIMGPRGAREVGVYQLLINDIVPEGTLVEEGDYVAQLDLTELHTELLEAELEVQEAEARYEQAILDSSLSLTQGRFNMKNLEYQIEERQIALEQSVYESPAVQRQAQIDLERAERQFEQEKVNYATRQKQLESRIRQIEASLGAERNQLQRIRSLENEFTIHAPGDGMIVYRRNNWGQRTTVGSTINIQNPVIAEMPDIGAMESVTYINEVDIRKIQLDQPVTITMDADRNKRLTGNIISIANIGEQRSGTDARVFEVVIHINEFDNELRPTMSTNNRIHVQTIENTLYAPLEAVHLIDDSHFVFKKNGSVLVMQQVIPGAVNANDVVLLAGVNENDELLISMPPDPEDLRRFMLPEEEIEENREEPEISQEGELAIYNSPDTP